LNSDSKKIAVFVDYDNQKVDPVALLEMLQERGRVVVRKAYADWVEASRYRLVTARAGFELIDCPKMATRKNSADVKLTLDCLEVAYVHPEIDVFVVVTGDSDFVPLISKLRTRGKETIVVVSHAGGTAEALQLACDEFIPAGRLERQAMRETEMLSTRDAALELYRRAREALVRQYGDAAANDTSRIKQTMLHLTPSFDERDLGFKQFSLFRSWADESSRPDARLEPKRRTESAADGKAPSFAHLPRALLCRAYLNGFRDGHVELAPKDLLENIQELDEGFTLEKYNLADVKELCKAGAGLSLWSFDGQVVRMLPEQRVAAIFRLAECVHTPEARESTLKALAETVDSWEQPRELMTLKEVRKRVRDRLVGVVSSNDISEVLRCSVSGGAFLNPEGRALHSSGLPFTLHPDVEHRTLLGYIVRCAQTGILEEDFGPISTRVFGASKPDAIHSLVQVLEKEGAVQRAGKSWRRAEAPGV